jgi:hypothetical protein
MHVMNMDKHICKHYLSIKEIDMNCILKCIPFDSFYKEVQFKHLI